MSTNDPRPSKPGFAGRADVYLNSEVHREGPDLETIVRWVGNRDPVCDVATGPGHVAGALLRSGGRRVVGLDPEPEMVGVAVRAQHGLIGVVGRAEGLPFPARRFSAVTCRVAAHHFRNVPAFLRAAHRVLERDGLLVLEDSVAPEDAGLDRWVNRVERWRDPAHVRSYTAAEWWTMLRGSGFEIRASRLFRRRLDYTAWIERQDPSPDRRRRLDRAFRKAPPAARNAFGIRVRQGNPTSFTLPKLLVRAVAS